LAAGRPRKCFDRRRTDLLLRSAALKDAAAILAVTVWTRAYVDAANW
jgi:hypothetical protein